MKLSNVRYVMAAGLLSIAVAACGGGAGGGTPTSTGGRGGGNTPTVSGGGNTTQPISAPTQALTAPVTQASTPTSAPTMAGTTATGPAIVPTSTTAAGPVVGNTPATMASPTVAVMTTPTQATSPTMASTPTTAAKPTMASTPTTAAKPTKAATTAPVKLPKGYKQFKSKSLPYTVGYPKKLEPVKSSGGNDIDSFRYVNQKTGEVLVFNFVSEKIPGYVNTKLYVNLSEKHLKDLAKGKIKHIGTTKVDGATAQLISYNTTQSDQFRIVQAIWTEKGRGWVMTMATEPKYQNKNLKIMKQMLTTFRATG